MRPDLVWIRLAALAARVGVSVDALLTLSAVDALRRLELHKPTQLEGN